MHRKPKITMADYEALMDPYYVAVADCIASGGVTTPPAKDDTGTIIGDDQPADPITVPF